MPRRISVTAKKKGKLTIQCDELWSFVDHKGNKQWVWLGLDADTREIVGVHIGVASHSRSETAMSQQPENYGTVCPQSIVSVLLPTPTFGQPMGPSSPVPDIVR